MKNKIYPFKFLDSYTAEDKDIFFGRDEEIDQLYQMIYQADILLLYGASGTGKTSLIQCGLASKFQKHDWLEIFVRRHKNLNESLTKSLIGVGGQKEEAKGAASENLEWLNDLMEDDQATNVAQKTLSQTQVFLKNIYLKHFRPIYLIFDQFEELFILGSKKEQAQFIRTVREILKVEQPVKLIFSIREEYLGSLYEFEKAVPELFRKKLRIDPMNLAKVKDVVLGATKAEKSIVHINEGEASAIAEQVFEKIRGTEKTLTIQLPYLQVFLDKFYRHISKDKSKNPTTEATFSLESLGEIGDIGNILRDFLDEQIVEIAKDQKCERKTIWKILSPFVTIDGTKEPTGIDTLSHIFSEIPKELIEHVVIALMNNRILRYIEEEELYEIAHDSLALRIAEKRSDDEIALLEVRNLIKSQSLLKDEARELFSEKQLDFINPFLVRIKLNSEEAQLIDESKKKVLQSQKEATRKKILGALLVGLVFIIIFSFAVVSNNEKIIARAAQEDAEASKEKNEKIINSMDFYDGKFALAFKNKKYGFIDTEGEPQIDFDYNKGEPFDFETGFAEMEIVGMNEGDPNIKYLIDTSGNRYRLINISEVLKNVGNVKPVLSEEEMKWLKKKLPKNKKQKIIFDKLEEIQASIDSTKKELISILNKKNEKLALDFSGLMEVDILNLMEEIIQDHKITDRVELLFFGGTDLSTLPKVISEFRKLKELDLSRTLISTLPQSVSKFEHLTKLDLSGTSITLIPEDIDNLKKLKILKLPYSLEKLPSSIYNLQSLEILNLSKIGMNSLPESIGNLVNLKKLHLPESLEELPSSIYSLKKLEILDLSITRIKSLSEMIRNLKNLKELHLPEQLEKLPSSLYDLEKLEILYLSKNINRLSESIGNLVNLKELYLPRSLEELPSSLYTLEKLEVLYLNSEGLKSLSEDIGNLINLKNLSLSSKLELLPESLFNLKNLEVLDLYSTRIKSLPESINNLLYLEVLILPNTLEEFPEGILELKNLEVLDINKNPNFKTIPDISNLEKLNMFSYTLYKNENYTTNKAKLKELQEKLLDCYFDITDEKGEVVNLSESNN